MLSGSPRFRFCRPAFTLVEAMVAITITGIAASVLLLGVEATLSSGDNAVERLIAEGLAEQLLDEALNQHYMEPGTTATTTPLGATTTELSGPGRTLFNDSDDYHNYTAAPPQDLYGKTLGTGNDEGGTRPATLRIPAHVLSQWRQKVEVFFVNDDDLSQNLTSGTSQFRALEVTISRQEAGGWLTLAKRRRVYAYLPPGA